MTEIALRVDLVVQAIVSEEGVGTLYVPEPGDVGYEDWEDYLATLQTAVNLYLKKNQHYQGAWRDQGWMGNVSRLLSKAARLRNMLWTEVPMNDVQETAEDTALDTINLAAFAHMNMLSRNRWGRG